jgi:isopentenyl-diphosphate delta-isomerase
MGFVTQLNEITSFIYKAPFANGLTEHELDHIMVGRFDNSPNINLEEVVSWKWMSLEAIKSDIKLQPLIYTEWFKIIFEKFYEHINTANESNSK